jgi:hypothetical protein
LLLIGQAFAQAGLLDEETGAIMQGSAGRFVRFAQPCLMAAMLVAALGVRIANMPGTSIAGGAGG